VIVIPASFPAVMGPRRRPDVVGVAIIRSVTAKVGSKDGRHRPFIPLTTA
jgi:hypothetical protein